MTLRFHLGFLGDLPDYKECWEAYDEEMAKAGTSISYYYANPAYMVAAIVDGDKTISFMAYDHNNWLWYEPGIHCCGAWTRPEYRRKGVYDTLIFCFTNQVRKQNRFDGMVSGAHVDNKSSWDMQMKQGRIAMKSEHADYNKSWLELRPTGKEIKDIEPHIKELAKKFPKAA